MRLSRRALLRLSAAGAAGWVLPACPSAAPRGAGPVRAKIHGQDVGFAHLLREGVDLAQGVEDDGEADVVVVGAGASGLSCAWRLRRAGVSDVRVIDLQDRLGGNAAWGSNQVSRFPWGAHYLRAPTEDHPGLERFLEEVGILRGRDSQGRIDWDTRAVCASTVERVFEGGLWSEGLFPPPRSGTADDEADRARFDAVVGAFARRRDAGGRRAFTIPLDRAAGDPDLRALDTISFATWLERNGFTRPAIRWYLDYACRDDYGCNLETTSAWAGLHYFAARACDDPSRDVILTWPEGNGRLIQLLASAAQRPPVHDPGRQPPVGDVRHTPETACVRLEPGEVGGELAALWTARKDGRRGRLRAHEVVFAGPQFVLRRLVPERLPHVDAFSYAPWLVANVTVAQAPGGVGCPLAWDNVSVDHDSLGYVVANRGGAPDAPRVLTWYRPLTGPDPDAERRALFAMDADAIAEQVIEELTQIHPQLRQAVQAVDAWRWGHAMVRPVPGFLWGADRERAAQPLGRVHMAHTDLSGISIFEEGFYRGVVAAEAILRRRGVPFEGLLERRS